MQPNLLGLKANLITQFHHGTTKHKPDLPLLRQKKPRKEHTYNPSSQRRG
ncbi:unnamed protein product, partial [Brassica oleracea var. botrytis]